uniref:Uncharacterized protein n=1 Tax=Caenorhabditis japonica TaxID=281687 RepID=A0A8R1ITK4_CAEJA
MPHIADTATANGVEFKFNPTGVVVEQRVEDLDSSAERMEEETMCQQYDDHRQRHTESMEHLEEKEDDHEDVMESEQSGSNSSLGGPMEETWARTAEEKEK